MTYFPFFIDIKGKSVVVIGGGNVAFRKVQKLISFEPEITVIAPDICDEISVLKQVKCVFRNFDDSDINGAFAVISATADRNLNRHIFELCNEKNVLVNTVDDKEKCGFIFPSLICKDDVTIGISTGGKSPLYAKYLRKKLDSSITDEDMENISLLGEVRNFVKAEIPDEKNRRKVFYSIFNTYKESGKVPSEEQIFQIIAESENEN